MRVIFAGGGTAGHINPAVAVAKYVKAKEPQSEILFIGTKKGMESTLVPSEGFNIQYINIKGFERKLSFDNIANLFRIIESVNESKKIIKSFAPDIVMGTGGYVAGPALYAATRLSIPTLIHGADSVAGLTNRILSRFTDITAQGFDAGRNLYPKAKRVEITGNPIRPSILSMDYEKARNKLYLDNRPFIVSFGGSLGAKTINNAVVEFILKSSNNNYQLMLSTGKDYYEYVQNRLKNSGYVDKKNIQIVEYIYNMDIALNAADIVITRGGAGSVSEIAALGKASVIIPSPNVTDNQQERNAEVLARVGGCMVIPDSKLTGDTLNDAIKHLLHNNRYFEMGVIAGKLGIHNADERIYNLMRELTDSCK